MSRLFMSGLVILAMVLDGSAGAARSTRAAVHSLPVGEIVVTRADMSRSPPRPDLYVMKPDGSHLRLLLRNAADAAASRDGTQIAFARDGAIWISRRDGSDARRITWPSRGVADDQPAWSRDGKALYFARSTFEYGQTASIFTIGTDGRGVRQLTRARQSGHEPACHFWPSVSPGGGVVAYSVVDYCAHGFGRWIAAVTTGGSRVKLGIGFAKPGVQIGSREYDSAAWAPKGGEIAYSAVNDEQATLGWVYLSATNGIRSRLLFTWNQPALDGYPVGLQSPPAWSSDGRWLALIPPVKGVVQYRKYVSVISGAVWLIRTDGSTQQQLTRTGMFTAAAWLPPVTGAVGGRVRR